MRRAAAILLLGSCFACVVEQDIAVDPKPDAAAGAAGHLQAPEALDAVAQLSAQLGVDVLAACERICQLDSECGESRFDFAFSTCTCTDQGCDCGTTEQCIAGCVADTQQYVLQGESCEQAIALILDCFRVAPCDLLMSEAGAVNGFDPDLERIVECQGITTMDPEACQSLAAPPADSPECGGVGLAWAPVTNPDGSTECGIQWYDCDGHDYTVSCNQPAPGEAFECDCLRDGVVVSAYEDTNSCEPWFFDSAIAALVANLRCGWRIPDEVVPNEALPVTCDVIGTDTGPTDTVVPECSLSAGDCSDSNEYSAHCVRTDGGYSCSCSPGTASTSRLVPTGDQCPLAGSATVTGVDAANAICGWNLQ